MKKLLLCSAILISFLLRSQTVYPSYKVNLLGYIDPNTIDEANDGRSYSGCWGWYQQSKNKEYAISGTSHGTYFIDVSAPATPTICDFVPGKSGCIWREMKTYSHYCYIVSDDPSPNMFQIVDMQYLPDSVHVVYSGTGYFERGHTIWIDQDKMYIGGITYTLGAGSSPMAVFSLANPEAPVLLRKLEQDIPSSVAGYVHDMYARNDTVFASCAGQGLQIFKLAAGTNTFTQLGSYSGYPFAGYNHSSAMTQNGKYMVFCDEIPAGSPIHFIDIQNLGNIQQMNLANPFPQTTPHNPYIIGNDFALVSSYQDGLIIFNISQLPNIGIAGYFDTHPQGGNNVGNYFGQDYRGNWGAYPFLPSHIIIAQDMQNGVFVLDANQAYYGNPVDVKSIAPADNSFIFYPNPAKDRMVINYNAANPATLQIKDMLGRLAYEKHFTGAINEYVNVRDLENGNYIISITENNSTKNKRLIINH